MKKLVFILFLLLLSVSLSAFELKRGQVADIACDTMQAQPIVKTAISMLCNDLKKVLAADARIGHDGCIIIKEDAESLGGRKEAFRLEVSGCILVVTGSDAHGMAYGILEISRLMGVSPWEWWADATPIPQSVFSLPDGYVSEQAPSVEFRGIFINDEDWGLMPWASMANGPWYGKGKIGPQVNERIFELLLRLRANTYWPAMHECTHPFFMTKGNREVAERYGIYIGGSHCEPMSSSTAGEWPLRGKGDYDYVNNSREVYKFWEDRIREVAGQPVLYTIGMRGVHDGAMQGAKTVGEQKAVLARVFHDQRQLLAKYVNQDLTKVPQVFIPYKEVLNVYNAGLQVPEDVCLMWCDDNYGYIKHFPTETERQRKGGNGIYYHVSYWGRPHDYLWLGTFSPALLFQQMTTAYDKGIQKIWILNVGDIKPCEYQMELFLDMAWNMGAVRSQGVGGHLRGFLGREFGETVAERLLPAMREHYRLAFIHKPEFMGGTRTEEPNHQYWNTIHDLPWSIEDIDKRLADYKVIEDEAERVSGVIPASRQDTYFQLVKYPILAAAEMNKKLLIAQKARHGLADWAQSDAAYDSISVLTRIYNQLRGGKWMRMMDCHPRRLPVFEPVPYVKASGSMPEERPTLYRFNGADATGDFTPCEDLGYEGKAVSVKKGKSITFTFPPTDRDSIEIEVRLLPVHPIEGDSLRFQLIFDKRKAPVIDFATQGRSEKWKENVLWNQAVHRCILPARRGKNHQLTLTALDEGMVVDQIVLR